MVRGDRPHSIKTCLPGAIRTRGTALSSAALVLAVLALLLALLPTQATAAQETQWVLTQTIVNPEKVPLEYYGGGKTPNFFGEERFKDLYLIYQVSATSFTVKDHWQDREYVAWDVTITCDFDAPESTLTPGKSYKLTARFSHSGASNEPSPGARFAYEGPEVGLKNTDTLAYFPWTADFNGVDSKTWTFTAPTASPGATMTIQAGLWNAAACTVIWQYEARSVAADATTTTTKPSTTTSASVTTESSTTTSTSETSQSSAAPRTFTEDEFEKMLADTAAFAETLPKGQNGRELLKDGYIGFLIDYGGDFSLYDHAGKELPWQAEEGKLGGITGRRDGYVQPIRIGDGIRTGRDGTGFVIMLTRYRGEENLVRIGRNTQLVFTTAGTTDQEVSTNWATVAVVDMLRGVIRYIGDSYKSRSIFSVKAGTTLCGMRGTDVVIAYGPENDLVGAWVHEGLVDVTDSGTGETKTLADDESLVVQHGELGAIQPLTEEQWDKTVADSELTADLVSPTIVTVEQSDQPGGRPVVFVEMEGDSNLTLILAVVIPVVVVVAVAAGLGVYLLSRRKRRVGGGANPRGGIPVQTDTSAPATSFCRHCGSPVRPGTPFCGQCGNKL